MSILYPLENDFDDDLSDDDYDPYHDETEDDEPEGMDDFYEDDDVNDHYDYDGRD